MSSTKNDLSGRGKLAAKVTTGGETIPVSGAIVHIKPYAGELLSGGDVLYSLRTAEDGMTEYVDLPAPDASVSQTPHNGEVPYSMYNMAVNKDGYYTVENIGIPIFDGISSIQPVVLLPLTANDSSSPKPHSIVYYESGSFDSLRSGEETDL